MNAVEVFYWAQPYAYINLINQSITTRTRMTTTNRTTTKPIAVTVTPMNKGSAVLQFKDPIRSIDGS